ncbi:MAG: glycosyltransferase [Bacteroidales bacterium]|nr:glycosyltransferase [Bacteroidales bacterium]
MNTAVLIPCYNEAVTIKKVVEDFKKVLPHATVYVYDNNSTDNTAQIALEAGAVVRKEHVQGKGNVIRRMFREIDADCYIIVDGDDTYPAIHAADLENAVLNNRADMAIGDRLSTTYFSENKRQFHNTGNKLVRKLIQMFWNIKINDIMTGYRAFSRRFVKTFPVMSGNFEIETEMTIHALDKRFAIAQIPVDYKDRPEGSFSKLNTFSDGISVLKTIAVLFREYRPLAFFSVVAGVLFVAALILFIPVLNEYLHTGLVPRFPTLFVAVFLALAALMSFFTGLCLDVIAVKSRKDYELKLIEFDNKS